MKTIKIIDLLNKIANGEAPKKILYSGMTYYFNKENRTYEEDMYEGGAKHSLGEIINIDTELNNLVFVIEDTPKEDKKYIEHIKMQENELHNHLNIIDKINEIIDKVNGDK